MLLKILRRKIRSVIFSRWDLCALGLISVGVAVQLEDLFYESTISIGTVLSNALLHEEELEEPVPMYLFTHSPGI